MSTYVLIVHCRPLKAYMAGMECAFCLTSPPTGISLRHKSERERKKTPRLAHPRGRSGYAHKYILTIHRDHPILTDSFPSWALTITAGWVFPNKKTRGLSGSGSLPSLEVGVLAGDLLRTLTSLARWVPGPVPGKKRRRERERRGRKLLFPLPLPGTYEYHAPVHDDVLAQMRTVDARADLERQWSRLWMASFCLFRFVRPRAVARDRRAFRVRSVRAWPPSPPRFPPPVGFCSASRASSTPSRPPGPVLG